MLLIHVLREICLEDDSNEILGRAVMFGNNLNKNVLVNLFHKKIITQNIHCYELTENSVITHFQFKKNSTS